MTKKTVFSMAMVLLGFAATLIVFPPPAAAQSRDVSYTIPFDFYVGETRMPAGKYMLTPVDRAARALQLSDGKGSAVIFMANPTENKSIDVSRLTFKRYGRASFLSEVHWEGYGNGRQLLESAVEREARNTAAPTRVAVVPE